MSTVTLVQLSDPHLSRVRPFFVGNWRRVAVELGSAVPDAVVVSAISR